MTLKNLIITGAAALALAFSASAQNYAQKSASGTTNCSVVFPGRPFQTVLCSVDATSDLSSSKLTFLSGGTGLSVSAAQTNSAATNLIVTANGVITNGNTVVIQTAGDLVTNLTVGTIIGGTNITFTSQIGFPVAVGDNIYQMTNMITSPVGATTVKLYNEALFFSEASRPLLVSINGTSACALNDVIVFRGTR
jgi:hypothetical protein